ADAGRPGAGVALPAPRRPHQVGGGARPGDRPGGAPARGGRTERLGHPQAVTGVVAPNDLRRQQVRNSFTLFTLFTAGGTLSRSSLGPELFHLRRNYFTDRPTE